MRANKSISIEKWEKSEFRDDKKKFVYTAPIDGIYSFNKNGFSLFKADEKITSVVIKETE